MISNISNEGVFYITCLDPTGAEIPDVVNPLGQGLSIIEAEEKEGGLWGYVSWFDKINNILRTIELKNYPTINEDKLFEMTDLYDNTYIFQKVDKKIYDTVVRNLIKPAPKKDSDEEVQKYLSELNSY